MQRTQVDSSNVRSIGWEDDTLEVEFNNGGLYQYIGVPKSLFDEMLASNSKGQFLNSKIKTDFDFVKIDREVTA